MFDDPPEQDDDMRHWFRYFRMTKYLPGMSMKFDTEMKRANTAPRAKLVLTAYAAAALDVVFFCGFRPAKELSKELEETFGLKPSQLMMLSVHDIAVPLKVGAEKVAERLTEGGFAVSPSGIITGFEPPAEIRRPRPGRKFGFNP